MLQWIITEKFQAHSFRSGIFLSLSLSGSLQFTFELIWLLWSDFFLAGILDIRIISTNSIVAFFPPRLINAFSLITSEMLSTGVIFKCFNLVISSLYLSLFYNNNKKEFDRAMCVSNDRDYRTEFGAVAGPLASQKPGIFNSFTIYWSFMSRCRPFQTLNLQGPASFFFVPRPGQPSIRHRCVY